MKQALYKHLASKLQAMQNCAQANNQDWLIKHRDSLIRLTHEYMPRGSGIDQYPTMDIDGSKPNRLVFTFGYHHMDEGYYTHWTSHALIITPSLANGFDMRITGKDDNGVKEYLYQTFDYALRQEVEEV